MQYRKIEYTVEKTCDVLSFLKGTQGYSARLITQLRKAPNGILLNGVHAKTTALLAPGDVLAVQIPPGESEIPPVELPLQVVYEDEDVLVVNKEAFRVCHPTRNHQGDTLANAVAYYLAQQGKSCTFRAINRLDRDTTGLVVIALNRLAACKLRGTVQKTYYAIATAPFSGEGTSDLPIWRPDPMKTLRSVDARGDRAVTHWKALSTDGELTLLEIHLETGRTHQIRVHFAHLGAPLLGDRMYGRPDVRMDHQALHCGALTLIHPVTGALLQASAPMPPEMAAVAQTLLREKAQ